MATTRELKTVNIGGNAYNYVKYIKTDGLEEENNLTYYSTTYLTVKLPDNYAELFDGIHGYTREVLYEPTTKHTGIDTLTILTTVRGGERGLFILFEQDGSIVQEILSLEEAYLEYLISFIRNNNLILGNVSIENSLQFIGGAKYGGYLEDYDSPLHVNQSGLFYNNKPILHGETIIINGIQHVKDLFDEESSKLIEEYDIKALKVAVLDELLAFDIVSDEAFIKVNGEELTKADGLKKNEPGTYGHLSVNEVYEKVLAEALYDYTKNLDEVKRDIAKNNPNEYEEVIKMYKNLVNYDKNIRLITKQVDEEFKEGFSPRLARWEINNILASDKITMTRINH